MLQGGELGLGFLQAQWDLLIFTALPCIVKFFPRIAVGDWLPGILLPPRLTHLLVPGYIGSEPGMESCHSEWHMGLRGDVRLECGESH